MSGHHAARVADRVRRVLADALRQGMRDPRIGFVTVTDVELSPDLRHAVAFVTVLRDEDADESLRALRRAVPFLRRTLARHGGLRRTPELRFELDTGVVRGRRLEHLFDELRAERNPDPEDG